MLLLHFTAVISTVVTVDFFGEKPFRQCASHNVCTVYITVTIDCWTSGLHSTDRTWTGSFVLIDQFFILALFMVALCNRADHNIFIL